MENDIGNRKISDIFNCKKNYEHTVLELKDPKENILIFDKGLFNTAICESEISRIEGAHGRLYYRGIPIENWVENHIFEEVASILIFGNKNILVDTFQQKISKFWSLSQELQKLLDAIPINIHPMDFLSIGVLSLSSIAPLYLGDEAPFSEVASFLMTQMMVIATYYYLKQHQKAWKPEMIAGSLAKKMLYQMNNHIDEIQLETLADFWNKLLILHAEHEQNCSTFTVRTVASSGGDVYSAISAGIAAFKGRLHGGASQFVFEMYEELVSKQINAIDYIKNKLSKKQRIMGLGHRVYRCWDPRAKIMFEMLNSPQFKDNSIIAYKRLANEVIQHVNEDEFFTKRNICPNPDLLNCIFYNLLGVPASMNTVMLSLSRVAGWLAHYNESVQANMPLIRPRQLSKYIE